MDWLNNPWISGVIIGIISGLIVYVLTDKFFGKQKQREHRKIIINANNNVLQNVKSFFIQKQILKREIIESMIQAVAIQNNLNREELFNIKDIGGLLVKEFMETSFLSVDNKKLICEEVYNTLFTEASEQQNVPKASSDIIIRRNESSLQISLVMALSTAMMTLLYTVTTFKTDMRFGFLGFDQIKTLIFSVVLAMLVSSVSMLLSRIIRKDVERREAERRHVIFKSYFRDDESISKNKKDDIE